MHVLTPVQFQKWRQEGPDQPQKRKKEAEAEAASSWDQPGPQNQLQCSPLHLHHFLLPFFPTVLPGVYMLEARLLFLGVVFEKGF